MAEREIWAAMKRRWPGGAERVETLLPPGLPDVHWTLKGFAGWFELKDEVAKVRPEQAIWHRAYAKAGGLSYVILRLKGKVYLAAGDRIERDAKVPLTRVVGEDLSQATFDRIALEVEADARVRSERLSRGTAAPRPDAGGPRA